MKYLYNSIFLLCILLVFMSGIGWLYSKIISTRMDIAEKQGKLDSAPIEAKKTQELKRELDDATIKVSDLQQMTVPRDSLPDVITAISQLAITSGITAQVPEVTASNAKGSPPSDPLDDVRIRISASGTPQALIQFLYRVEQLPYLLYVTNWSIDTTQQVALGSFSAQVPTDKPLPPSIPGSALQAELVIAIKK